MPILNANQLATIVQLICAQINDPIAIFLFGARAAAAVHDSSEIDIAVLPRKPLSTELRWDLWQELAIALKLDVDRESDQNGCFNFALEIVRL